MLNSYSWPKLLYGVLLIVLVTMMSLTLETLPDPFVTHFNSANEADRWMTHTQYWLTQALISIGTPAIIVVLLSFSTRLPSYLINLPNKDYWLHPDRQAQTQQKTVTLAWWMACILIAFAIGIHYNLVLANQSAPPALNGKVLAATIGGFALALVLWLKQLKHMFAVPE